LSQPNGWGITCDGRSPPQAGAGATAAGADEIRDHQCGPAGAGARKRLSAGVPEGVVKFIRGLARAALRGHFRAFIWPDGAPGAMRETW